MLFNAPTSPWWRRSRDAVFSRESLFSNFTSETQVSLHHELNDVPAQQPFQISMMDATFRGVDIQIFSPVKLRRDTLDTNGPASSPI